MWLGEQITERGIGNGMSLIIFAGIIAGMPMGAFNTVQLVQQEVIQPLTLLFILAAIVVGVAFVVFVERGQRRIPVQYSKRVAGRKMYGGSSSYLPLRVNTANVIPPIFASSLLLLPATLIQFFPDSEAIGQLRGLLLPTEFSYNLVYGTLIIFFTFFYTSVIFHPEEMADNLKKFGGYIPGIRPGKNTADYIERVMTRITAGAALYLAAVCVLPNIMLVMQSNLPFYFGGTALLIVVVVAMDFMSQVQAHLMSSQYAKLMEKSNLKNYGRSNVRR
jgi:preprotein translocase subunit SecY